MNKEFSKTAVDLTNCDREPIHIPGSIQPHGCLLACDISARRVLRHSENIRTFLGLDGDINGRMLDDLFDPEAVHTIRNTLARSSNAARSSLIFGLELRNGRSFDVAVHILKSTCIIEFEQARKDVAQPMELARALIGRISTVRSVERLVRVTARLIQGMLGYDRVMVYQFAQDGSGKVISEEKRADLESFLGQHFPSSDIPQQARELYLRNTIRIISDVNFERIPLVPTLDPSGEPLDLSLAHLRSVSPIHCEYLRNMGVGASMSISIVVDGVLWGLIACHHYGPRILSMAERVAAELFGDFFSLHLDSIRQSSKLDVAMRARRSLDHFLRRTARASNVEEIVLGNLDDFVKLVACDGAGIWLHGKWKGVGSTPSAAKIVALARFAEKVTEGKVWATQALSNHLPDAEGYAAAAAGVMIVPLSQRPRDYLFFFRKELVQTLNWAGNPDKSYETGPLGDRLTPRKSFDIWKETVYQQAMPWSDEDREIAEATRSALVEVVLHQNELLEEERSKAEVRQRILNEELNHRVKNILAVIKSLVALPSQDGQSLDAYVQSLRGRIQALAFAHDQVVRGNGGGSLVDLINAELTPYRDAKSTIALDGPPVWLDARAFSVMALMLHELSTNAAKYGALSRGGGKLSIRWTYNDEDGCVLNWQESGGPKVVPPSRRGFGTVLIDRSIPFDLGGESNVEYLPEGLRAQFRLPVKYVSPDIESSSVAPELAKPLRPGDVQVGHVKTLIVEDQMLIAMNLEQILLDEGISEISIASSAADALALLRNFRPDIAILDVNLGLETSFAVADELAALGIPFMFATGYGEDSIVSQKFPSAPVVRKPYESASIIAVLTELITRS
jgi:light-regulated signal transduction histidine kinase (bacteriophytochrome)/CheY-like chemotaxis protein